MKNTKSIFVLSLVLFLTIASGLLMPQRAQAVGISIDAGLTPAAERWMLRSQMRYMERGDDPTVSDREMTMYGFPVVIAYGLRSDITLMARPVFMRREMTMMGESSSSSGFGDLMVMGKYRLVRINTRAYTFGIAPTVGMEFPTGEKGFTSDSYDLRLGTFFSGRMGKWGMDLNVTYFWNGMIKTEDSDLDPGDEFSVESAVARQLGLGSSANFAIAPVLELSYINIAANSLNGSAIENTGESVLWLSPGLKITYGSFILESLVQFPAWQDQKGTQMERSTGFLVGFRLMN